MTQRLDIPGSCADLPVYSHLWVQRQATVLGHSKQYVVILFKKDVCQKKDMPAKWLLVIVVCYCFHRKRKVRKARGLPQRISSLFVCLRLYP